MNLEGGFVKRTPDRVLTPTTIDDPRLADKNIQYTPEQEKTKLEKVIDEAFNERDRLAAGLLDLDRKYDILEDVINDQTKNMNIPATNRAVRDAVKAFGGDNTITQEVYNKAKKTMECIETVMGLNPLHIPFAKPTKTGKAITQYTGDVLSNCSQITESFPNSKIYSKPKVTPFVPSTDNTTSEDGIGEAGTNPDGSLLTSIQNLLAKAKFDMARFLEFKMFWDILYAKFIKKLFFLMTKVSVIEYLLRLVNEKIKGIKILPKTIKRFIQKLHCISFQIVYYVDGAPDVFGWKPPDIGGAKDEISKFSPSSSTQELFTRLPKEKRSFIKLEESLFKSYSATCAGAVDVKESEDEDDLSPQELSNLENELNKTETTPDFAGDGISDSKDPFQEGFIPPQCYEKAQTILDAVYNDALFGNKGSKKDTNYNSSAVILTNVIREMRDFHEVSKMMMTIQDDSDGSKALMKNTADNPKYNRIFMNKDVLDYRNTIFKKG